jgi:hypothetical protein
MGRIVIQNTYFKIGILDLEVKKAPVTSFVEILKSGGVINPVATP